MLPQDRTIVQWWDKNDPQIHPSMQRDLDVVNSIILHTTGVGLGYTRLLDQQEDKTDFEVHEQFAKFQSKLEYLPTFTILPSGGVWQFAPLSHYTWHAGVKNANYLKYKSWKGKTGRAPLWLRQRYGDTISPVDFPCYEIIPKGSFHKGKKLTKDSIDVNWFSLGIDLLPYVVKEGSKYVNRGFTKSQYDALVWLIKAHLVKNNKLFNGELGRLNTHSVLTHSDVDPISRSTSKGPWDFGDDFNRSAFYNDLFLGANP